MRNPLALLAIVSLLAPAAAPAQTSGPFAASDMESARGIVGGMQSFSRGLTLRDHPAAAGEAVPLELLRCGPWGVFCAQHLTMAIAPQSTQNEKTPFGAGFKALGPVGKTGKIDGPGGKGNGAYRVDVNEDYRLEAIIKTGYMAGRVVLTRDPATGAATMRFAGRRWDSDKGEWGAEEDKTKEVVVEYDAKKDRGTIRWVEDGEWKSERYWGGAEGADMTIEFGGGWDHDFQQDP